MNIKSKICESFYIDVNRVETEALLKKMGRAYYKACYLDFNNVALRGCFSLPKSVLRCRRLFVKTFILKSYRMFLLFFFPFILHPNSDSKEILFGKFRRERSSGWDKIQYILCAHCKSVYCEKWFRSHGNLDFHLFL